MIRIALALGTLLAGGGCVGAGCNGGLPPIDDCSEPQVGSATSLEIGRVVDQQFVPIADGDIVPLVVGGQGASMIFVAFRMTGDVPACIEHETVAYRDGGTPDDWIDQDSVPRRTYDMGDGSRATGEIFLIMRYDTPPGSGVRVRVDAAGQTAERLVYLEFMGERDAAVPDAGWPDAGRPDAGVPDAGPGGDAAAMLDAQ